jgi:hypothetical protein
MRRRDGGQTPFPVLVTRRERKRGKEGKEGREKGDSEVIPERSFLTNYK